MVHTGGPQGCIFSCPHCGTSQALPAVGFPGASIPVQGPSLRAVPLPEGVHQVCVCSPCTPPGRGAEDSAILGRLAGVCAIQVSSGSGYAPAAGPRGPLRAQGERSKEQPGPFSAGHLPGCAAGHHRHEGLPIIPSCERHSGVSGPSQERQGGPLFALPAPCGQTGSGHICGSTGLADTAPSATVDERPSSRCQVAQAEEGQGVPAVRALSGPMEGAGISVSGSAYGLHSLPQRGRDSGRLPRRLGGSLAEEDCTGAVVRSGRCTPHQCARVAGYTRGTQTLCVLPEGEAYSCPLRQHVCCVPGESSRGDQVSTVASGGDESPDMGRSSPGWSEGYAPTRSTEPGRRLPLPAQTPTGRVAASPRGGGRHLGSFRTGRSGPLCLRRVDSLSSLVLLDRGLQPSRAGCSSPRMAEGVALRLSPSTPDLADTSESPSAGPQASAGGPLLAGEDLVSTAAQALLQLSVAPSQQEGSPLTIEGSDLAPRPGPLLPVGLASAGPDSRLLSCSDSVRSTILNARAPSTRVQYASRWRMFSQWCADSHVDPVHCPVAVILDFLQSLFDSGRSHSTLKVFVAAISSQHTQIDGVTVGSHRLISLFLKGVLRLRPPRARRAPAWDLPLLLEAVCRPPFEPLAHADLKWLSMKAAFLLAVVSAKRVGELHALSVSETCLRWNPDGSGVILWPNVAFLPKVLTTTYVNQPIKLACFDPPSGEGGSPLLCPVRALQAYIDATAGIRQGDQLFVCYGGPRRGSALSKQRLSHWIVDTIEHAYRTSARPPPSGVRGHSTRGVAASWAALRGVPLDVICAAASWASPSTFTRFYRVNVAAPSPLGAILLPGPSAPSF